MTDSAEVAITASNIIGCRPSSTVFFPSLPGFLPVISGQRGSGAAVLPNAQTVARLFAHGATTP